jgi:hypothetical protein
LAITKSLTSQLLETNVSDKALFEKLSGAYRVSTLSSDSLEIEVALWAALEVGLNTADATEDRLM